MPYVTSRGGPLVGEELLLLQGIPADCLLLTKETEDNLKDLAGNAMSTTVVGACTLAALLVAHKDLSPRSTSRDQSEVIPKLVPRPLVKLSEVSVTQKFGKYETQNVSLGPAFITGRDAWNNLLSDANYSSRMSTNEGDEEALPSSSLVVCTECGHTTSKMDADRSGKYEEHVFASAESFLKRVQPSEFRARLLEFLPMHLLVTGFDLDALDMPEEVDKKVWESWLRYLRNTLVTPDKTPAEFRFTRLIRSEIWTAVYATQENGRLEARISASGVEWFLFTKMPRSGGKLKAILERPVARLKVAPPPDDSSFDLLKGDWKVFLPVERQVMLEIQGFGNPVASWRNRLGLKGAYEKESQYEMLKICCDDDEIKPFLQGSYRLLPKCGGACGSLMKRVQPDVPSLGQLDTFFFLSCGNNTLGNDDFFVFASTCHRTNKNEYRETYLELDPSFRLEGFCAGDGPKTKSVRGTVRGAWRPWKAQAVVSVSTETGDAAFMRLSLPTSIAEIPCHSGAWKVCPEFISCSFPVSRGDDLFTKCVKAGGSLELYLSKSTKVLEQVAFAMSRLSLPRIFQQHTWLALDPTDLSDNEEPCAKCSPPKPRVKFTPVEKAGKIVRIPLEDGKEAAQYERAMKTRPHPWIIRFSVAESNSVARLNATLGCNAVSVVQRAFGLLPRATLQRKLFKSLEHNRKPDFSFEWRVVPHVEKVFAGNFSPLYFTSNKKDAQAKQPPNFSKFPLRKEQLRSLTWMLQQESTTDPFFEEEVCEELLPGLNWRAEGRIRRPVAARGGCVADAVGYGVSWHTSLELYLAEVCCNLMFHFF